MSSQIPCYVVNLASDTERRSSMEAMLAQHGLSATFFTAVDGRIMAEDELESHVDRVKAEREYGPLTRAEIGTSLSHIEIYRDMVKHGIPHAVILEDDVCLREGFPALLDTTNPASLAQTFSPDEPAMLQLTHVDRAYRGSTRHTLGSMGSIVRPYGNVWLTSGYFITLAAARRLATELYPVWTVADHWGRFEERGYLKIWALTPHPVWESEHAQQSNISPQRKPRRKAPKTLGSRLRRLGRELVKPLQVQKLPKSPE